LNNVVKHAQPVLCTKSERHAAGTSAGGVEGEQITMVIQDDGVGYASAEERPATWA